MQTYKFKKSGGITGKRAKIYGQELAKIQQKNNGTLTPQAVVEEARDKKSVLHKCFDWNDSQAGEKWRLFQARQLISSINVVISYNGRSEEIDAYVNVTLPKGLKNKQAYVDVITAMTNQDFRKEIITNALNELLYWQDKYRQFQEFNAIFNVIKRIKKKIKK